MSTTLQTLRQELSKSLGSYLDLTATATDTATKNTFTDAVNLLDAGVGTTAYVSWYIIPTSGKEDGNARRVSSYDRTTGKLTVGQAWTTGITTADTAELHGVLHPTTLKECINLALGKGRYECRSALTLLSDGGMESSAVTDWDSGTVTPTKSTTIVWEGKQSGTASGGAGTTYIAHDSISVLAGENYYLEAVLIATSVVTLAGTFTVQAYDATNSAAIESLALGQASVRDWTHAWIAFEIPSTCTQLSIRFSIYGAVSYCIDDIVLQHEGAHRLALPSWVASPNDVIAIERRNYQSSNATTANNGYGVADDPHVSHWGNYRIESQTSALAPLWVNLPSGISGHDVPVVRALRAFDTLSTSTATTNADKDWVLANAKVEAYRRLRANAPIDAAARYDALLRDATIVAHTYNRRFQPMPSQRVQIGYR